MVHTHQDDVSPFRRFFSYIVEHFFRVPMPLHWIQWRIKKHSNIWIFKNWGTSITASEIDEFSEKQKKGKNKDLFDWHCQVGRSTIVQPGAICDAAAQKDSSLPRGHFLNLAKKNTKHNYIKQKSVDKHKTKHKVQKYIPPSWILSLRTKQSLHF